MLTSRMRVLGGAVAVAVLGLTGVAAASPAFAADSIPRCSEADRDDLLCLTHGEVGDRIKAKVRVEDILCVRVDALAGDEAREHGVDESNLRETVDLRLFVPCPRDHVARPKPDPVESTPVETPAPVEEAPVPEVVEADLPVTG